MIVVAHRKESDTWQVLVHVERAVDVPIKGAFPVWDRALELIPRPPSGTGNNYEVIEYVLTEPHWERLR